jgi:S-adenosyl-L-methionine hydrolase (adenosine-forming)
MGAQLITFLSDYGYADGYAGICHGVIARRCPTARVIDISHAIPPQDVRAGALVLADSLPYMPPGVHLAIVDPDVGAGSDSARVRAQRALALRTVEEDRLLVGPDNGLLMLAAERFGGVAQAVAISRSRERLEPVSHTFHGRDIFAPVAGALAAGEPLAGLGEELDAAGLSRLELPRAHVLEGVLTAHVLLADRFGNLTLDASPAQIDLTGVRLGESLAIEVASRTFAARYVSSFAEVPAGELLLYEDSRRMAAIAVNRGSAAERLGAERDQELPVRTP